ncbi:hypothetical protein [Rickettsia endosymbiont of Cantharis rufa]|uniref:hypothetical protein n=1 Tax=Rickettsia endosymbiont of Cantharis rufa TaxID=3066248 RepID=UPI003132FB99
MRSLIKTIQDEISKDLILEGEMLTIDQEIGNKTVRDNLELLNGVLKRDIFLPDYICKVKAAFKKKIQEQNDLENTSLSHAPRIAV